MFTCFLDARKAFDRVNHWTLFSKLLTRGMNPIIVRILMFWYGNHRMCVAWNGSYSNWFSVSNGVRQGGKLSPFLFNVYIDDLIDSVAKLKVGCMVNNIIYNIIAYADDIVLLAPSCILNSSVRD